MVTVNFRTFSLLLSFQDVETVHLGAGWQLGGNECSNLFCFVWVKPIMKIENCACLFELCTVPSMVQVFL